MKGKKSIPIIMAVVLIGVSCFSGCVGPWAIDTLGWEHIDLEGTVVRIWGQLTISESSDNWNEGFVWDTEPHDDWQDYAYRVWADNHAGLGLFSLNIDNLTRTTEYHYRAFGEYLKGKSQYRVGADVVFIPGGPRVVTDNATGIGLTQATLNGNLWHMGGASSCTVYFLYGTDENALNQQTTPESRTMVGPFTAPLTSLTTNTTYYYKAVAENDADTWSGVISKVTPGQPVVISRQPGEISKDHAILKAELWNTGGTATCTVWFVYSDVSPNQLDQSTPPQIMNATGAFQAYIGNLTAGTTYWYRTVGDNGIAQGKGDIIEFSTTPTAEIKTSGELGKPYKPNKYTLDDDLTSRIPTRYLQLLHKYPILLKLLQQPRIRALLSGLQ
ncbi:MAG: fibronectin type III domain-containing protein [Euryarchaeota archaeon]|nr:fibronectin type III domain-containing protein [Euryarchaeota archaeon]